MYLFHFFPYVLSRAKLSGDILVLPSRLQNHDFENEVAFITVISQGKQHDKALMLS